MNQKQIDKLRLRLREMRKNPHGIKAATMRSIAGEVKRKLANRGKEPNYVREQDPHLSPPLSIPGHSTDLKPGTARSIIDAFLDDLDAWELFNAESEDESDDEK